MKTNLDKAKEAIINEVYLAEEDEILQRKVESLKAYFGMLEEFIEAMKALKYQTPATEKCIEIIQEEFNTKTDKIQNFKSQLPLSRPINIQLALPKATLKTSYADRLAKTTFPALIEYTNQIAWIQETASLIGGMFSGSGDYAPLFKSGGPQWDLDIINTCNNEEWNLLLEPLFNFTNKILKI